MNNTHHGIFSSFKGGYARALLVCAMIFTAQPLSAQELSRDGLALTPSLEQQYKSELDRWMLQAYEGDRDAQFKIGVLFTVDQFNSADYQQAVYWYKQAARQGHVLAQYNLGHQYLSGAGVTPSEKEAMSWWLKAAELDHPLAQFNVGRGYYLGIGLDKNLAQSEYWFKRAAMNNEPKSIDVLKQLGWAQPGEFFIASTQAPPPVVTNTPLTSSSDALLTTPTKKHRKQPAVSKIEEAIYQDSNDKQEPIPVYTNPNKQPTLISILDIRDTLTVIKRGKNWARIKNNSGFPVWVHERFVSADDASGTIKGNAVNARSVPLITSNNIVGRLNNGDKVLVLNKQKQWYRVMSPNTFVAWVKLKDLTVNSPPKTTQKKKTPPVKDTPVAVKVNRAFDDENDWLFSQPADYFTLQLESFDDPQKIAELKARKEFINNPDLWHFTATSKGFEWTYFLYGRYANKSDAITSRDSIGQQPAWVRTFGVLQQSRCLAWKKKIPTPRTLNKYCS